MRPLRATERIIVMSRFSTARFWFSKEFLNNIGRGIMSQIRMRVLKNCPSCLVPDPSNAVSPVIFAKYLPLDAEILTSYCCGIISFNDNLKHNHKYVTMFEEPVH